MLWVFTAPTTGISSIDVSSTIKLGDLLLFTRWCWDSRTSKYHLRRTKFESSPRRGRFIPARTDLLPPMDIGSAWEISSELKVFPQVSNLRYST